MQSKLAFQLLLGSALSSINNFDFKITNNNYFSALPDCLSLLLNHSNQNFK
jgi:hypothetical protein